MRPAAQALSAFRALADRPGETPAWPGLAATLRGQNEYALADRAYAVAFREEPGNAQLLWDHAQLLEQMGRSDASHELLRQLAAGSWAAQFEQLQKQARKLVETDPVVTNGEMVPELHKYYGSAALVQVNEIHKKIARP